MGIAVCVDAGDGGREPPAVPGECQVLRGLGSTEEAPDPPPQCCVQRDADGETGSHEAVHPGSWMGGRNEGDLAKEVRTHVRFV